MTFSEQFLSYYESTPELKLQTQTVKMQRAIGTKKPGQISKQWNNASPKLDADELGALLKAKDEGLGKFAEVICQQLMPIIMELSHNSGKSSDKKASSFRAFYESVLKNSTTPKEKAEHLLMVSLFVQYTKAVIATIPKAHGPDLATEIELLIKQIARHFKTPSDVMDAAYPTPGRYGPITTPVPLTEREEADRPRVFALVQQNIKALKTDLSGAIALAKKMEVTSRSTLSRMYSKKAYVPMLPELIASLNALNDVVPSITETNLQAILHAPILRCINAINKIDLSALPRAPQQELAATLRNLLAINETFQRTEEYRQKTADHFKTILHTVASEQEIHAFTQKLNNYLLALEESAINLQAYDPSLLEPIKKIQAEVQGKLDAHRSFERSELRALKTRLDELKTSIDEKIQQQTPEESSVYQTILTLINTISALLNEMIQYLTQSSTSSYKTALQDPKSSEPSEEAPEDPSRRPG